MKAFVIAIDGHAYSQEKAARCIESARSFGVEVSRFSALTGIDAQIMMELHGLKWTWARGNKLNSICPITGLKQHPYGQLDRKIGCAMSHYSLWLRCVELNETLLILEHDAVFLRALPEVEFAGICQVNDPRGATPQGQWWSGQMSARGPGVYSKTKVFEDDKPDGLAGNSAYLIKPAAAQGLIDAYQRLGVWPNDATMCRQLFRLQELFPFVTKVDQQCSTTS